MNRFKRDKLREEVTQGDKEVSEEFSTDPELVAIREVYTKVYSLVKSNRTSMHYGNKDSLSILTADGQRQQRYLNKHL